MYSKHTLETKSQAKIVDMREMLRVKLKSLAAESRIIRREESRTWGPLQMQLRAHRVGTVRDEARYTLIAYCLIRGRTLEQIEPSCQCHIPDVGWAKIGAMLRKYGPQGAAVSAEAVQAHIALAATPKAQRTPKVRAPRRSREEYAATLTPTPGPQAVWPFDIGREAA